MNDQIVGVLGMRPALSPAARLALPKVEVEKAVGQIRPDLLGCTAEGVAIAIEVAYSSFCDMVKVAEFAEMCLPALEIDLRAFTPDAFDPEAVKAAIVDSIAGKAWLWPEADTQAAEAHGVPVPPAPIVEVTKARLPEEIVTISGRWVSIKEFESGDIAVRVIRYDPDVVSLVKTIAKANHARYSPKWKSWNVPRWRASIVRAELRSKAETVSIVLTDR